MASILSSDQGRKDIQLLHSSNVDLASLLPPLSEEAAPKESYDYVKAARETLKIAREGTVDAHGERLESLRGTLETLVQDVQERKK